MEPTPHDETVNPTEANASEPAPAAPAASPPEVESAEASSGSGDAPAEGPAKPAVAETPVAETRATEAPVAETPAAETPAAETPAAETSTAESAAATMAAALPSEGKRTPEPRKGGPIRGRIVKIGEEGAFVDFGGREEAFLDLKEIRDAEGKPTRQVGDEVRGIVTSVDGGVKMSLRAGRGTPANLPALLEAQKSGLPVEGKVTGVNKGGLVVQILGIRAFCPFSQIDRHWVEDPSVYVGQRLAFRVSSADPKGRNVVLSRRALIEQETREKAEVVRRELAVGKAVKGRVVRLRPFGAFVDLGGLDGLIHVSEMSHRRVKDPSEILQVGQEVEVRVRSVENLGQPDERIGLSLKDMQEDPWVTVTGNLKPGSRIPAKVVRLAEFGAFMEVAPGIDGLAHVSTLADERVEHPSDVLQVGQELEVWVVSVDPGTRRISLSVVDPSTRPERGGRERSGDEGGWSGDASWGDVSGGREGGRGRREGGRRDRRDRRDGGRREGGRREGGRRDQWRDEHERSYRSGDTGMTSMQEAFERLRERN